MSSDTTLDPHNESEKSGWLLADIKSGLVVCLVALPLCLGIALASGEGVPLFAGLLAGIVGGLVVGPLSGSHTSVSGPAAGLTAVVAAQLAMLGSFDAFLLSVVVAGVIQLVLGFLKAGALSAFFPSSVIKGLLAAIGVILILKQIPHLVGDDREVEGSMSFEVQTVPGADEETNSTAEGTLPGEFPEAVEPVAKPKEKKNTFTELWAVMQGEWHAGAFAIGLLSVVLLLVWDRIPVLKNSLLPGPLAVVIFGVVVNELFKRFQGPVVTGEHLVVIPEAGGLRELAGFLRLPDFSRVLDPRVYVSGATIAIVASLETLLNLQAVDKLDKYGRVSPPSRELLAQGVGNIVAGFIGGLPITSVVIRGSVNVNSGNRTKFSAIFHGALLLLFVGFLPHVLNRIPLSALAAILIVTGFKLASVKLFRQMASEGRYQFIPFIVTLLSIVFTDLLTGILIGLGVAVIFILNSNLRRPVQRIVETHVDGELMVIELTNQVTFLNRAALDRAFNDASSDSNFVIDASHTDYIDPDVLSLIREFRDKTGPARGVNVSLRGFDGKYSLQNDVRVADYSSRELQDKLTPQQALRILQEGNRRFRTGNQLKRDLMHQQDQTALAQNPFAAVLSCIDSRVPAELVLDCGIGDIFSVRIAGNVLGPTTLGSLEYAVAVSGVKLVLVMGHTRCGAVSSTINLLCTEESVTEATGCDHLASIVEEIDPSLDKNKCVLLETLSQEQSDELVNEVVIRNVHRTVKEIIRRSPAIRKAVEAGQAMVVGAMYDVRSGAIDFFAED